MCEPLFHFSQFSPCHVHRHESFGGIHPYKAVQAHQRNMVRLPFLLLPVSLVAKLRAQPIAVQTALKDARISALDLDGIAFTRGPGNCFLRHWRVRVARNLTENIQHRHDRLSWGWFQRCQDTCCSS